MATMNGGKSYCEDAEDVECFRQDEELMAFIGGCEKNPGHKNLTRIHQLTLETLPKRIRDEKVLRTIKLCAKLVVRIVVGCTSPHRPKNDQFYQLVGTDIRRTASGYVRSVSSHAIPTDIQCDCRVKTTAYGEIDIITNKHVVYDDVEAASTTVELFYDSFFRKDVKILHGLHLRNSSDFLDVSHVTCVTHDPQLVNLLTSYKNEVVESLADIPPHISASGVCVAISHPHGLPKVVSAGDIIEMEEPEYDHTDKIWTWHLNNGSDTKTLSKNKGSRSKNTGGISKRSSDTNLTHFSENDTQAGSNDHRHRHASAPTSSRRQESRHVKPRPHSTTICRETPPSPVTRALGAERTSAPEPEVKETFPEATPAPKQEVGETSSEGQKLTCRYVSRYMTATCRGSSGGPVFVNFGSSKKQLFCFIHSRYDKQRRLNVSRRKNIF